MMSSSDTEVTSNGVQFFLVKTKKLIKVLRLDSSDGTQSLPEAVAENVVDNFLESITMIFEILICNVM